MILEELVDLSTEEQIAWLNRKLEEGLTGEEIFAALGSDKAGVGKFGIFLVGKKFMVKPMRGYQTTRLSGNEKADDAGIQGGSVIK
jgi:hypothetical protein